LLGGGGGGRGQGFSRGRWTEKFLGHFRVLRRMDGLFFGTTGRISEIRQLVGENTETRPRHRRTE
jgi:hypothetical protein